MADEELGLRELNEIARKEKNARMLLPLSHDFYTKCQDYILSLENALKEEEKGTGQNPKVMMLREELQKANSKVSSIFSMRQRKILILVYNRSSGAGREADLDSLTGEEKMFYEEILSVVEDSRNTILGSSPMKKKKLKTLFTRRAKKEEQEAKIEAEEPLGDPRDTEPKPEPVVESKPIEEITSLPIDGAPPSTPTKPNVTETQQPTISLNSDMTTVVVMEELPPIMGPETVYELVPQDVVSLPTNMALLLEKKGKVKRLDPA